MVHYTKKPPCAFRGDRVHASPHRGAPRDGTVRSVETHYGWGGKRKSAYHVYAVVFDGQERSQWVGEDSIHTVYAK